MKPVAKQFSFIGHPARIVFRRALELVHGIEKIDLIYFDHTTAKLEGEVGSIENFEIIIHPLSVDLNARLGAIIKQREKESNFEWFESKELPYIISEKNTKKRNIFNEKDIDVLLVRIPNLYDGKKDLLFLFFDKEMKSFGLSKGDKELTATIKTIFEKSFVKLLIQRAAEVYSDQEILADISENVAYSGKNIERLNQKVREAGEKHEEILEISANQFLEKYSRLYHRSYVFTEGAIAQIKKYAGKFSQLEEVIKSAIQLANNLMIIEPKSAIPISEVHLNFTTHEEVETQKASPLDLSKYSNTVKFLDRLENAAISVKMKKLPLTSENVASAHNIPIKPPAISYGAKYHKDKIIYLLNNYPDKWSTIRNDFKPLLNLIERDPDPNKGKSENNNAG